MEYALSMYNGQSKASPARGLDCVLLPCVLLHLFSKSLCPNTASFALLFWIQIHSRAEFCKGFVIKNFNSLFCFWSSRFFKRTLLCSDVFWHCSSHSAPWGRLAAFVRELYCCCCCFLSSVERLLLGMIFLLITLLCSFLLSMMKSLSEEDLFTYRKNLLWSIFLPHLGRGKSLPCTSSQFLATSSIAFPVHLVSNVDRYCARDFLVQPSVVVFVHFGNSWQCGFRSQSACVRILCWLWGAGAESASLQSSWSIWMKYRRWRITRS